MDEIDRKRNVMLGARVWTARMRAGVGPEIVARSIGVSPAEVSQVENGIHPRTQELAPRALQALAEHRTVPSCIIERFTRHLN